MGIRLSSSTSIASSVHRHLTPEAHHRSSIVPNETNQNTPKTSKWSDQSFSSASLLLRLHPPRSFRTSHRSSAMLLQASSLSRPVSQPSSHRVLRAFSPRSPRALMALSIPSHLALAVSSAPSLQALMALSIRRPPPSDLSHQMPAPSAQALPRKQAPPLLAVTAVPSLLVCQSLVQ